MVTFLLAPTTELNKHFFSKPHEIQKLATFVSDQLFNQSELFLIQMLFLRFPKNEIRKKKWIDAVRRDKWSPSPNTFLCSEHFEAGCFFKTSGNKILKPDAIPTIFNFPPHLQKKKAVPRTERSSPIVASTSFVNIGNTQQYPKVVIKEHNYSLLDPKKKIEDLSKKNLKVKQSLKCTQQIVRRRDFSIQEKDKIISEMQNCLEEKEKNIIDSCFSPVIKELLSRNFQMVLAYPVIILRSDSQSPWHSPINEFWWTSSLLILNLMNYKKNSINLGISLLKDLIFTSGCSVI